MILTVSLNSKYEPIPSSPRKVEFSQILNQTLKQFCYSFFRIYYKGNNFREDYSKLGVLFALLPEISCIAITATKSSRYEWYRRLYDVEELQIYHWQPRQEKYFL